VTTLYLICCSMRTGSTLLQRLLLRAGLGNAQEYLHGNNPACDSFDEYAWHIRNGNGNGSVMGWRVMWGQLWEQQQRKPERWQYTEPEMLLDGIIAALHVDRVRYIHLTRRDKLRQAVSFLRAESGRRWWCPTNEQPHDIDIPFTPETVKRVEWLLSEFPKYDAKWNAYFAARGIDPLRLVYEDFTANDEAIRAATWDTIRYIGAHVPDDFTVTIPMRKQAGDDVERWIAQYDHNL